MPKSSAPALSSARTRIKHRSKVPYHPALSSAPMCIIRRSKVNDENKDPMGKPLVSAEQKRITVPRPVLQAPPTRFATPSQDPLIEKIDEGLNHLGSLVDKFQLKVDELARDFNGLRDALAEGERRYEALEIDYRHALEVVEEEKLTAEEYYGHLRNAEVQIEHLINELPSNYTGPAVGAFSQAKF